MPWTNSDGLTIYFGQEEAIKAQGGEYRVEGLFRQEDIEVNLATLTSTPTLVTRQIFPWGKVLGRVEIITDVVATGGTSVSFGFNNLRTNVVIAAAGALNAYPTAQMATEGQTSGNLNAGTTYAGTLVGTTVAPVTGTMVGIIGSASGTYTAGRIRLRLNWYKKTPTT